MKTRKLLNELTRNELSALYDANSYIKETIYTRRADDESYYISNEIFSYFEHYDNITNRRKFSALFDERYNNCMIDVKIENYPDFISDCLEFDKHGLGFSDEIKPLRLYTVKRGLNMRIIEIIARIDENIHVQIISNISKNILSEYDGKNNIDKIYNNRRVYRISIQDNILQLFIL